MPIIPGPTVPMIPGPGVAVVPERGGVAAASDCWQLAMAKTAATTSSTRKNRLIVKPLLLSDGVGMGPGTVPNTVWPEYRCRAGLLHYRRYSYTLIGESHVPCHRSSRLRWPGGA